MASAVKKKKKKSLNLLDHLLEFEVYRNFLERYFCSVSSAVQSKNALNNSTEEMHIFPLTVSLSFLLNVKISCKVQMVKMHQIKRFRCRA